MNHNQCVPNWDIDDVGPIPPSPPPPTSRSHCNSLSVGHDTSMLDYEMAELTWKNGQLTMHGLGVPRVSSKTNLGGAWNDKPCTRAGGTLESIVSQATYKIIPPLTPIGACNFDDGHVPFINSNANNCNSVPASVSIAMDALVPSRNDVDAGVNKPMGGCSTRVGSCSAATARVPVYSDWSVSASESDRWGSMIRPAEETCEELRSMTTNNGVASTSFGASLDNTTTRTLTIDDHDHDHDSVCHSKPQRERGDEEENEKKSDAGKSTSLTKRSRAAAVHNQSERKRRDKINQRMKTLQKLVPNSNKTDKASMLDEVIDYLKQLQAQVNMLNAMRLPSMLMPLAIQQQQLQMSMMAPMTGMSMGMGFGLGMGMDQLNMNINNAMGCPPSVAGLPPIVMNAAAYMSLVAATSEGRDRLAMPQPPLATTDPISTYLACQSNPMTMDAYSKMAAMYQQLQQLQQNQHQQTGPSSNT